VVNGMVGTNISHWHQFVFNIMLKLSGCVKKRGFELVYDFALQLATPVFGYL